MRANRARSPAIERIAHAIAFVILDGCESRNLPRKCRRRCKRRRISASQSQSSEITNEHFLLALLEQTDGVTRPLLEKLGVAPADLEARIRGELERRPKVSGADVRLGNELRKTLDAAEREMAKLKDEFTSAEHYLLALTGESGPAAKALKDLGVNRDKLMQALQQVRGSQRVTDQNPEGKYQSAGKIWPRSDRAGAAGEDRSGDRPR